MRLFGAECRKVWSRRTFLILLALMVGANLLLLWMGSRPSGQQYDPSAYRKMQASLRGLSMDEKQALIYGAYEKSEAMMRIEQIYEMAAWGDKEYTLQLRHQYAELLAEYEQAYLAGDKPFYTGNQAREYAFLTEVKKEFDEAAGYDAYLDGIAKKASQLSDISIFASTDAAGNYDQASIAAAAGAYEGMRGIAINYAPQKGLVTALGFGFSDIILLFAMLVLATLLVADERESGMLALVRGTPAGRWRTAFAKLLALAASLLAVVLLLYASSLLLCQGTYGLGSLWRSIQSVPALLHSTLRLDVWQYLGLFLLAKWGAAFVCGAWVMLAVLVARQLAAGYALAVALPAASYAARAAVSATGHWNVLKYANLASLLRVDETLGRYLNLYWFGQPLPLARVQGAAALLLFVLFTGGFALVFAKAALPAAPKRRGVALAGSGRRMRGGTTVLRQEGYKLLVLNGALAVLVALAGWQAYQCATAQNYVSPEEIYYKRYMQQLAGPYTRQKYEWLQTEKARFDPLAQLDAQLSAGRISEAQYWNEMGPYYASGLPMEYEVFQKVAKRVAAVAAAPGAQLVYDTGYAQLFGLAPAQMPADENAEAAMMAYYADPAAQEETTGDTLGRADLADALLCAAVCALCFAGLFAMERTTGMVRVGAATPLGRRATAGRKLAVAGMAAACVALLSLLPRYWLVAADYGFSAPFAPASSLPAYTEGGVGMPLCLLMALAVRSRLAACLVLGGVCLVLSHGTGSAFLSLLGAGILFCLPPGLALLGVSWTAFWGVYPLFHFAALFTTAGGAVAAFFYLAAACAGAALCARYLLRRYGREGA